MALKLLFRRVAYLPQEAITLAKAYAIAPFDESIDIAVTLNVDPRKGDQIVRGTCMMPAGLGKPVKVAVFTSQANREEVLAAGADEAGQPLFDLAAEKTFPFDKALATPDVADQLKPFGRFLGPRGLMPSVKFGTIVRLDVLPGMIAEMKMGSIQFRVEKNANIHCSIGRASFEDTGLLTNLKAMLKKLAELKPASVKGKYFKKIVITSTHGPAWELDVPTVDPTNRRFSL